MAKKLIYRSELRAHTTNGIGYITRQQLEERDGSLYLTEDAKVVEGEELRYCFLCGCEWLNIVLEGSNVYSTKRIHEESSDEPLEERAKAHAHFCLECESGDSDIIRKTNFLDKTG